MWVWLGLGGRLRDLAGVDRVRGVDWSDHGGLLRGRIGRMAADFSVGVRKTLDVGKGYSRKGALYKAQSSSRECLATSVQLLEDMGSFAALRMTT